jgi:trans-AT polyketide synthase/acyltransferase/oxidoreductase domain-containing protein
MGEPDMKTSSSGVAWLFPGQGAQRTGMGAELFDRYPALVREADQILGYSVRAQCVDGAEPGLQDTRHVQPALFIVSALSQLALAAEHPLPQILAGHSVGEYNALFAARCFDFGTGVRLVQRRGELMARMTGGGMTAVVGLGAAELESLLRQAGLADLDLANRNSAVQMVLSGPVESLDRVRDVVRAAGGRCVPLRVSAPFHSRYMAAAAAEFAEFLQDVEFTDPVLPVIANVTAEPYPAGQIRQLLARQIDHPVRWWESMSALIEGGVTEVVEVGPGQVLTGLWEAVKRQPCPRPPAPEPATPATPATAPAASAAGIASTDPVRVPGARRQAIQPESLGSAEFRSEYGIRYAYLAGAMYKGIASVALVIRMAQAGLMGFFGAGGLSLGEVEAAIRAIRAELGPGHRFGMNLLASPDNPAAERETVDLYLRHDIRFVEAASYTGITPGLVQFRFAGTHRGAGGQARAVRHVVAKVSRPEVARAFMAPPPDPILDRLVAEGALTATEAAAAQELPVAADVCVEADSGGHTDAGNPYALLPAMRRLRDDLTAQHGYRHPIRVGAAGGIGSPEAAAAAFVLGADFVLTGSVNQCSPEAGTSDAVKDMLADLDVQDTAYAPAGDMFELGARVQVARKGTMFAARANKLYQLYRQLDGLDQLDAATRTTLEERYFRQTIEQVWAEVGEHLRKERGHEIERAEAQPKVKMALVFRWYFAHSTRLAMEGVAGEKVNYQIHCGPAQGAFNRCVAGTALEPWRARHVEAMAELLMTGAAAHLDRVWPGWVP